MSAVEPRPRSRPQGLDAGRRIPGPLRIIGPLALLLVVVSPADAAAATADEPDQGIHRGVGWYDADARIPEPPIALALVIVGAWAMRRRDRRRLRG